MAALIRSAGAGLALAVVLSGGLPAQVTGTWLTAGFGGERIERRDRRVSPARYAGVTAGWSWGAERRGASTFVDASFEFVEGDLMSGGVARAVEHLRRTTMDASFQLAVRGDLLVGLQLGLRAENAEHTYPLSPFTERFDVAAASLSPVITWTAPARAGAIRIRASAAALSLVDREYSRSKAGSSEDVYAGPASWAAGTIEVSRLFREGSRVSWKLLGRATAWSHRTDVGAANVETRATFAGRLRLGRVR